MLVLAVVLAACKKGPAESVQLAGYAVLPAATFAEGPPSGAQLGASVQNGMPLPFARQPVQGFSALIATKEEGVYLALADNGYGAIENSADFNLRVYRIKPSLREKGGGSGAIAVLGHIELRDPDRQVPFAIRNFYTHERVLTGADFDVESLREAPDGSLYFGDEFGPFLLHTDATGKLLEPPIPLRLPDGRELRAPQNPYSEESSALRVMNAIAAHARKQSAAAPMPVFSPSHVLLRDGNEQTAVETRKAPPPGSGLRPAASEIFEVASMKKAGYPVVAWTPNELARMQELLQLGVSGLISDRPDLLLQAVRGFDGDGDGTPDYLTPEGLIDARRFDAQGHRGGRNLRPENTLPAMEVALDHLMTTLESDVGISLDGVALLSHEPHVAAASCRRADGGRYEAKDEVLIAQRPAHELQKNFICDRVFRGPEQKNEPALSPVSRLFAAAEGMPHVYAMPTVAALFRFTAFYADYYRTGAGRAHPEAALRAKNAERVRYNLETKLNPRRAYAARTLGPEPFADKLAALIEEHGLVERVDIQSFDFRTLLRVHAAHPRIRTVCLFGDFPAFSDPGLAGSGDGTNLQDEDGQPSPWLAGLPWPYRVTAQSHPQAVRTSGGFEGMAQSPSGTHLLPMLEKPLAGESGFVRGFEYDLTTRRYLPVEYRYPLEPAATAVPEFLLLGEADGRRRGLVIERDDREGRLDAWKRIYEVTFPAPGSTPVTLGKRLRADLLRIPDPDRLAGPGLPGDVGLGPLFALPYFTIEALLPLSKTRLIVVTDNNLPFSVGRHLGTHAPDDTELIVLELRPPLW